MTTEGEMPHLSAPDGDATTLTASEAFLAMYAFLWFHQGHAGDDLGILLGDMTLMSDGKPTDPAAWEDWMNCVRQVKGLSSS